MKSTSAAPSVLSRFLNLLLASLAIFGSSTGGHAQSATLASYQEVVFSSQTLTPYAIAQDAAGDLYIADAENNQVLKVPAGGGSPSTVGSGLNFPTGVALDGAGNVYIADNFNNRVVTVPAGTGEQSIVGSGLKFPAGVALDASGDVFIADSGNNRVVAVSVTGKQTTLATGFNGPVALALDSFGNLYVSDSRNNRVAVLPWTGYSFGTAITKVSGLNSPWQIAFDAQNNLYIANIGGNQVVESALSGTGYGSPVAVGSAFQNVHAVAVDPHGMVYAGDPSTHEVVVLDLQPTSVNFGNANICVPGQTQPAPCGRTITLNFLITGAGADTPGSSRSPWARRTSISRRTRPRPPARTTETDSPVQSAWGLRLSMRDRVLARCRSKTA